MRLGVISDTHDELARMHLAVQLLRDAGCDALVHCGDLIGPRIVEALAGLPSWFVFGNHDADMAPALRRAALEFGPVCLGWASTIELAGRRIGVVHGHLTTDVQRVLAAEPEIVLSGHSHISSDVVFGSVRRINPGALHRAEPFTAAVLDLKSGELQIVPVQ